ncbi:hypothetical protein T09_14720 [Trichinella sp. T9]|nr:hypothetical protein T09_14720 [Trichinella sp. T9]
MVQVKIKSSGNSILFSLCDLLTCVNEYPRDDIWAPLDNTLSTCAFVYHFGRLFQSRKEHGMFNLSKLTKLPYHLAKGDQSAKLALIDHQSTTLALARHLHQVEPLAEVAETFLLFRSNGLICIRNVPVDMSELLPIGLIDSMQMLKS